MIVKFIVHVCCIFFSLRWIAHIKDLLYKCCQYLEELKPESPTDMQSILVHLHTLIAFTATNTWALTRTKNFDKLRIGMTQLCANIMGSLFHKGYYITLKVNYWLIICIIKYIFVLVNNKTIVILFSWVFRFININLIYKQK